MCAVCAQKVMVAPPVMLDFLWCQKQFLTFFTSSLKPPVGGASYYVIIFLDVGLSLVSSPGRDSRDIRSSRLAEASQKPLGTNAL